MKKNLVLHAVGRGLFGIPTGIAIGYVLSIVFSLCLADGSYAPCVPQLMEATGSEIGAVMLQAALSGLLGAGFAAASVIWEIERLGLARQTGLYFFIASVIMMPTAYFLYWMEHSAAGFFSYFGIFFLIFLLIWIAEYTIARFMVRKMNANLHRAVQDQEEKD